MKQVELICVSKDNNNKYYKMTENKDGLTFTGEWGRIGYEHECNKKEYPMSDWNKKYKEKTRPKKDKEHYTDITSLRAEGKGKTFKDVVNPKVKNFLDTLQSYSKQSVAQNYVISSQNVTSAQVAEAQNILNELVPLIKPKNSDNVTIDKQLMRLYTVVPRKMDNVKNYILGSVYDFKKAQAILIREQGAIDALSQQVSMNDVKENIDSITLEDILGVKISEVEDIKIINKIKDLMGDQSQKFVQAYSVEHKITLPRYKKYVSNEAVELIVKELWHGSRNENWLNILKTGLMIRPTGVVLSGSMFGNGIYFADKARKSIGYTSISGSYWSKGTATKAYLAIFEVNTGKELHTKRRESWMSDVDFKKLRQKGSYDSLFAEGGVDLINNEYIVYREEQCTIKYIVEIK